MSFNNGFLSNGFRGASSLGESGAISQPAGSPIPGPTRQVRVPSHAIERMERAQAHVNRAIQAIEAIAARYDRLEETIGIDGARRVIDEVENYLERSKGELQRSEEVVRETAGSPEPDIYP